jgi:hypothetical protein
MLRARSPSTRTIAEEGEVSGATGGEVRGPRDEHEGASSSAESGPTTASRARIWDDLPRKQQDAVLDALLALVEADLVRYPPRS